MTTVRGKSVEARDWLESQGLVAKEPAIRSSDYETILSCPFQYYLSRRLGLVSALRWSAALSRGSWFHKRLEFYEESSSGAALQMEESLREKYEELEDLCAGRGIIGEEKRKIFEREEKDMLMAMSWFEAMQAFQVPSKGSVVDYLSKRWFKKLGSEVTAQYEHPEYGKLLAQYDLLLYHETQNAIYIVDAKTCAGSTINRLSICPVEFQTQHYMHILNWLLETGVVQEKYGLPDDVRIGGMIHIAVQKPTIEFGMKDRDFEEVEHIISRGPRKGQIELRRNYSGEPRWQNYRDRCRQWFLADGIYEDKKPERNSDPPLNFSLTYGSSTLSKEGAIEYHSRLNLIRRYSACDPVPGNFPMSAKHLLQFGKLSPFTPFYLTEVKDWPSILSTEGFIQEDRDCVEVHLNA